MEAVRLLFVAPRREQLAPVDLPDLGPGRLLVRTRYSGISTGTELLGYRGLLDPDLVLDERIGSLGGTFGYPFPYGYSCVGEVEHPAGIEAELQSGLDVREQRGQARVGTRRKGNDVVLRHHAQVLVRMEGEHRPRRRLAHAAVAVRERVAERAAERPDPLVDGQLRVEQPAV
ncbi:MAG: hypothetical protein ACLGI3_19965, partial [Actinomycetes bacterium]